MLPLRCGRALLWVRKKKFLLSRCWFVLSEPWDPRLRSLEVWRLARGMPFSRGLERKLLCVSSPCCPSFA